MRLSGSELAQNQIPACRGRSGSLEPAARWPEISYICADIQKQTQTLFVHTGLHSVAVCVLVVFTTVRYSNTYTPKGKASKCECKNQKVVLQLLRPSFLYSLRLNVKTNYL